MFFSMDAVHAQAIIPEDIDLTDPAAQLDSILRVIYDSSRTWTGTLYGYATRLFWLLVGIQFVWTFFPLVFKQADFAEIISEVVRFILVTGFFLALLMFSKGWTGAIIDSFQELGFVTLERGKYGIDEVSALRGRALHPGTVFGEAIQIAYSISSATSGLGNTQGQSGQIAFYASLTLVTCFVFIAGFMSLALIESWLVINVSVLFMGLGGSEWTRHYARQMLTYALSVGVKLFVMTLIIGLIMSVAENWKKAIEATETVPEAAMWTLMGLSILAAFFVKTIPDLVQSLITGATSGAGSATSSMESASQTAGYPRRYGGGGGAAAASGTASASAGLANKASPETLNVSTPGNPNAFGGSGIVSTSPLHENQSQINSPPLNSLQEQVKDPAEVGTIAELAKKMGTSQNNTSPPNIKPDDKEELA